MVAFELVIAVFVLLVAKRVARSCVVVVVGSCVVSVVIVLV